MNCYHLHHLAEICFPEKANNMVINDILKAFTFSTLTKCSFTQKTNTISIGSAEKILEDLNFDEDAIYKCKIACLLHDVGALQGKEGHTERSYEYAKKLFEDKKWIFKDSEIILEKLAEMYPTDGYFLSLMSQYTPFYRSSEYKEINRRISTYEYEKVREAALRLGFEGYMQERSSAKEEYTPDFDLSGIADMR